MAGLGEDGGVMGERAIVARGWLGRQLETQHLWCTLPGFSEYPT